MMPTMKDYKVIAIDGPAASGKGTLARRLAAALNYAYLDTGALYRAVALRVLTQNQDPHIEDNAHKAALSFAGTLTPQDLQDPALRTDKVGQSASIVAKFPNVRTALLQFQKEFAQNPPAGFEGVVMDGRDIGTVICPDAPIKLFVTASLEARSKRRFLELTSKGIDTTLDAVIQDMIQRDARDSGRDTAPLKPANDAHILDTSDMDAEEAMDAALSIAKKSIK